MAGQHEGHIEAIDVEVYMADSQPPPIYDFYISRSGALRRTVVSFPVHGLIQVVMMGRSPPSGRQLLTLRRHFGIDEHFRVMKFY